MKKINSKLFKLTMSKYATGVTVITINIEGKFMGKTVNSFASLSLDPPLVLFSLDKKSSSLKDYKNVSFIGINVLSKNQIKISNHFSNKNPLWDNTNYFLSKKNTPIIKDCIANLDCEKIKTITQGDHIIFICKISEIIVNKNKKPLIYFNSNYI